MPPFIDLTGQKFNRLTVIKRIKPDYPTSWECCCSCGNTVIVTTNSLRSKKTQSCGCLRRELGAKMLTTHGMYGSPEHRAWRHMKERCCNPNTKDFKNYGGRGITVCNEWRKSFMAFFNHVGKKPSPKHSIDRINNDGNYEPSNVRWADRKTQNNNSRRNYLITIDGITKNIAQWAEARGISRLTICNRLHMGWSPEKSVLHPVRHLRSETINVNGVIKTTKQWAKIINVRPGVITNRLTRGWSPERAVTQPVNSK